MQYFQAYMEFDFSIFHPKELFIELCEDLRAQVAVIKSFQARLLDSKMNDGG